MQGLNECMQIILKAGKEHKRQLGNAVIVGTVFALDAIGKVAVFSCPCNFKVLYSVLYLASPAFFLFVLGILLQSATWRIITGARRFGTKVCRNGMRSIFGRCLLAPCVWIFITLMDGLWLACARADCDGNDPTFSDSDKSMSQLAGFIFLVLGMVVAVALYCRSYYVDNFTYEQRQYSDIYKEVEREVLEEKMKEAANKEAKENSAEFLKVTKWKPKQELNERTWGELRDTWDGIVPKEHSEGYTPLYRWAKLHANDGGADNAAQNAPSDATASAPSDATASASSDETTSKTV